MLRFCLHCSLPQHAAAVNSTPSHYGIARAGYNLSILSAPTKRCIEEEYTGVLLSSTPVYWEGIHQCTAVKYTSVLPGNTLVYCPAASKGRTQGSAPCIMNHQFIPVEIYLNRNITDRWKESRMPQRPLSLEARNVDNATASPVFPAGTWTVSMARRSRKPAFARLSVQEVLS